MYQLLQWSVSIISWGFIYFVGFIVRSCLINEYYIHIYHLLYRLQQQFNRFIFKLEQQEYEKENIAWSFISFPDNQDVIDLIEKKHSGIFSILDEQCKLAKCTDSSYSRGWDFVKCSRHKNFAKSRCNWVLVMSCPWSSIIFHVLWLEGLDMPETDVIQ